MSAPTEHRLFVVPAAALVALGPPAAYLGMHGLASLWPGQTPLLWATLLLPISIGWHAGWLGAVTRSSRQGWILPAWLASTEICRRGLIATGFGGQPALWAVVIETTLLGVALQLSPSVPFAERLGRIRRSADDLSAQLRNSPGLLPWLRTSLRLALRGGTADRAAFAELAVAVRDAEARLGAHLSHIVLPEQTRESLLTRARDLASQAELASLETSMVLEHHALAAAAAFRDECRRLDHLPEDERDAITRRGQTFLLECAAVPVSLRRAMKGSRDDVRH